MDSLRTLVRDTQAGACGALSFIGTADMAMRTPRFSLKSKFSWWNGIELPSAIGASIYIFGSFFLPSRSMAGKQLGQCCGTLPQQVTITSLASWNSWACKKLERLLRTGSPGRQTRSWNRRIGSASWSRNPMIDLLFDSTGYLPVN